jgi:long-chain acyl-CoA synthetase
MAEYWNNKEETAKALKDGWLYTGDMARVDGDGYYWFVCRKKEVIIRGGSNISPPWKSRKYYMSIRL